MGNKAKRRKVAAMLKERGLGPLYICPKRRAYRWLTGRYLDNLIRLLQVKPGDLLNDCDGFNHVVKKSNPIMSWSGIIDFEQFEFEDGTLSCGCPGGPEPAKTREQVEDYFDFTTPEIIEEQKRLGWWSDYSQKIHDAIQEGRHFTDERGVLLPEFRRTYG